MRKQPILVEIQAVGHKPHTQPGGSPAEQAAPQGQTGFTMTKLRDRVDRYTKARKTGFARTVLASKASKPKAKAKAKAKPSKAKAKAKVKVKAKAKPKVSKAAAAKAAKVRAAAAKTVRTAAAKVRKAAGNNVPVIKGLTTTQVILLRAVCAVKVELTYNDIRGATGILKGLTKAMAANSGKGASYPTSLEGLGLVTVHEAQGNHGQARFCVGATTKGRKALKAAKAAPKPAKAAKATKPAKGKGKAAKAAKGRSKAARKADLAKGTKAVAALLKF